MVGPAPRRARGFTLVELAITLLILALLATVGMPYGRAWIDGNRQIQARNQLMEGLGHARALGLRNPNALLQSGTAPVEAVRLVLVDSTDGKTLKVLLKPSPAGAWADGGWQGRPLADGSGFKLAGDAGLADVAAFEAAADRGSCLIAFDTRGRPFTTGGCALPSGMQQFAVGLRDRDPLHVPIF